MIALLRRRGLATLAAGLFLALVTGLPAVASPDDVDYENITPGSGTTDPGPPSPGAERCEPSADRYEYCYDGISCRRVEPSHLQDYEYAGIEAPPFEGAHMIYEECDDGRQGYFWSSEDDGPSLVERMRTAQGRLVIPDFAPSFNPPGFTVVNVATWWWAEGLSDGQIVGSEALGLRAIGTPSHMVVDPGDGSGSFRCGFSVSESDACTHEYRRASHDASGRDADGRAAFTASVTVVYDLHFEIAGERVDIPDGVPEDLLTLQRTEEVPVRVVEIQTVVRGSR